MSEAQLSLQNLSIAFGEGKHPHYVVTDLNLDISRGQCVGLVGESGSGKSMTALAIMQLLPFAARVTNRSRILWQGADLLNYSERAMRHVRYSQIGMIFQDAMSALNPVLTIGQQMKEVLKKRCRQPQKKAFQLLSEVGIDDPVRVYAAYPHQLSGGMRQRAMIALALSGEPSLIIADEPTTALDVTIQAQILALLNELKTKRNLTLLFISHDLAVVSQVADDIAVLRLGKLVERAPRHKFYQHPQSDYARQLLAAIPPLAARKTDEKPEKNILNVRDLKVYFPNRKGLFGRHVSDVKAVDKISFTLSPGKTLALVGESGSGKTTTAKAIVRLVESTGGEILFEGKNIPKLSMKRMNEVRSDIQMIFQDPYAALNPRRMIADSIIEAISTQKTIRNRRAQLIRVDELLEKVGLSLDYKWRYPHEFSGGERQRICIARALALEPKCLILDEPTSALDVSIQMQVLKLLEQLQTDHHLAYLLITHNFGIVAYLSHELAVMQKGHIVEQGPTETLLQNPKNPYTKQLLASVPIIKG